MNKTIEKVLSENGFTTDMVTMIIGKATTYEFGYTVKIKSVISDEINVIIQIFKNVQWTDGSIRPIFGGSWDNGNVTIYLNNDVEEITENEML